MANLTEEQIKAIWRSEGGMTLLSTLLLLSGWSIGTLISCRVFGRRWSFWEDVAGPGILLMIAWIHWGTW